MTVLAVMVWEVTMPGVRSMYAFAMGELSLRGVLLDLKVDIA